VTVTDKNNIKVEQDERGVLTLTLNRPDIHNAFDDILIARLTAELLKASRDDSVRIVVLTGEGKSFSSGGDLNWMRSMANFDEEENLDDALALAEMLFTLNSLNKPTIAKINGHAFGGGVGLIACCDIAIAANHAKMALTEVRLGLIPAVISPYLIGAIGQRQARRLFMTAESIDAAEARACGLVHLCCPADRLAEVTAEQIEMLLRGGPAALAACKSLIAEVDNAGEDVAMHLRRRTAEIIAQLRVSDEGQEGLTAFLQKRPATWDQEE
jgi:methylglutaconyl-CoA hydratase